MLLRDAILPVILADVNYCESAKDILQHLLANQEQDPVPRKRWWYVSDNCMALVAGMT